MQLIDGKATAMAIKQEIAQRVKEIVANGGKQPHLAAILVGHDGGSETYVAAKVKACGECGFNNQSNFNRIFKSKKGQTPRDFRASFKKNKTIV